VNYKFLLVAFISSLFLSCGNKKGSDIFNLDPIVLDSTFKELIVKADKLSIDSSQHLKAIELVSEEIDNDKFEILPDTLKARVYHKMGTYCHRDRKIIESRNYLAKAINLWNANGDLNNKTSLAQSYYVLSISYQIEYNFKEALNAIQKGNAILKVIENIDNVKGKYFSQTGMYFYKLGENNKAFEYLDQAEELILEGSIDQSLHFFNYALLLANEKRVQEAIDYYDKSIEGYKNSGEVRQMSIAAEIHRLELLYKNKSYGERKSKFIEFINGFEAENNYMLNQKHTLLYNLAYAAFVAEEYDDSAKYFAESFELAGELSENKKTVNHGLSLEGMADVEDVRGNYDEAIRLYQEAIKSFSIGFDSDDINSLPDLRESTILDDNHLERVIGFKIGVLSKKYQNSNRLEDLKLVHSAYQSLDLIWTQMRQGYKAAMSRYELVEKNIPQYEQATNVALELFRRTNDQEYLKEAYRFASKNKAIVMLDGLQDEEAKFSNINAKTLEEETNLKQEIYKLDAQLFDLSNAMASEEEINEVRKSRFEKSMEYDQLISSMEKEYPNYYQLKYSTNNYKTIEDQKKSIPVGAAVVEYFVGLDSIYTFFLTKDAPLRSHVIKKNEEFNASIDQFILMIKKTSDYSVQEFAEVSHKVYNLLLAEVLDNLEEDIDRLFIIPDNKLMQISFDVLLTDEFNPSDSNDWTNPLPYLLRKYALSYAYSNQLLFDEEKTKRLNSFWNSGSSYLGFGLEYDDFTLSGLQDLQPTEIDTTLTRGMGKLIYSVDEIKESSSIMNGEYYLNENATKETFLKRSEKANILHLAMHGFVVKKKPMNSGMIFTRQNEEDDFILKASDLYTMKLKADLAVLSACHTGDGLIKRGEGIRSIARAFNYAGCPNVTASLWAAPDLSTKKIVLEFYKNLNQEQSIDVALQNAKLSYLDQCKFNSEALPHLWAHLVTIGDTSPIID